MQKLLLTYILVFASFQSFGQIKDDTPSYLKLTQTDSVYLKALEKYTVQIDSFYNKYSQKDQNRIVYINYENYLSRLPKEINGYQIILLDSENRKKYFRKSKNKLRLVEVTPLTIKNKRFHIRLTPYFAELKGRKNLYMSISDWTIIYFDWIDGALKYAETENNGI
jgi:hypothetical protein